MKYINNDLTVNWEYVETIPEFARLKECEQNPKWHSEGNAWEHTKKCVEAAYELFTYDYRKLTHRQKEMLLLSVLFHDIGKGVTTEFVKGNWHAYGHEIAGERIARRILWNEDIGLREFVCSMTRWHMEVLRVAESKDYISKIMRMACMQFFDWRSAIFVKLCDSMGSKPEDPNQGEIDQAKLNFLKHTCILINCYEEALFSKIDRRRLFGKPIDWASPLLPDRQKSNIWVFIGLPGAGKDTFIKKAFEDNPEVKVLCRDDIRAELGYCKEGDKIIGTPEQENRVTQIFNSRLIEYARNGLDIVINNINLKKKYRTDYHQKLESAGLKDKYLWTYAYIEAPSIEDNIKRRDGQIPANAYGDMIDRFDWPTPDEYDDIFIEKQLQKVDDNK